MTNRYMVKHPPEATLPRPAAAPQPSPEDAPTPTTTDEPIDSPQAGSSAGRAPPADGTGLTTARRNRTEG